MTDTSQIAERSEPVNATEITASPYDAVPYSVSAFPQTSPDRLATIATLFGMKPAAAQRCRVLELGCARGGNIIPMAMGQPQGRFVGIDLSSRQIAEAREVVAELNLQNVELKDISILDVGEDFGQFDYILCHGVYSWVPPAVQEAIMEICRRNLAPQGVAYISYNALPGWHARGAIREMMWYHTTRFTDPADKLREARGLLGFLLKAMPAHDGGYSALIRQELAVLARSPDTYLLHEHLEEYNEPLYFNQFIERAAAKGLQYLGEAQVSTMIASRFGAETEKTLRQISADLEHMEQYMDFLRNRMFRQTLICHAKVKVDHTLRPESVRQFRVASPAKPVSESCDIRSSKSEQFRTAAGLTLTTHDPLMKAAMLELSAKWPRPSRFEELLAAAGQRLGEAAMAGIETASQQNELATRLLNCFTLGLIEFSMSDPSFVTEVSERPVASGYARLRARAGSKVVNMRLERIELTRSIREFLQHLDGQYDRAALVAVVRGWLEKQHASAPIVKPDESTAAPEEVAREYIDRALGGLARSALLVG